MDDVHDLVNRCLAGDEGAAAQFVEQFQQAVFGVCFRMLGHRQDAEDAAQESLARGLRSLHRWDGERPILPWLLTIATNRCRTALSKRAKRPVTVSREVEPSADGQGHDRHERMETAEEVQRAVGKLRPDYQSCFVLFYQQDLSCAEIAEILDRPAGTIKTWLSRARNEVGEELKRRGVIVDGERRSSVEQRVSSTVSK